MCSSVWNFLNAQSLLGCSGNNILLKYILIHMDIFHIVIFFELFVQYQIHVYVPTSLLVIFTKHIAS